MGSHASKYTVDPLQKYAAVSFMASCDQRRHGLEQANKPSNSCLVCVVVMNGVWRVCVVSGGSCLPDSSIAAVGLMSVAE